MNIFRNSNELLLLHQYFSHQRYTWLLDAVGCLWSSSNTSQLQKFNRDIENERETKVTKVTAAAESSETRTMQSPNLRSSMQRSTTEAHVFAAGKPKMHEDQYFNIDGLLDIIDGLWFLMIEICFCTSLVSRTASYHLIHSF